MPSQTRTTHRPLLLTEEEALALLEVCLLSGSVEGPVGADLMGKLGQVCRDFMREDQHAEPANSEGHATRRAFRRMLRVGEAPARPLAARCA